MCARATLSTGTPQEIAAAILAELDLAHVPLWRHRFNAAPSDRLWIVRQDAGPRELLPAVWGLRRGPAKRLLINERCERYRDAKTPPARRCVMPVDGFFEWNSEHRPTLFRRPGGEYFWLAGLYDLERDDGLHFSVFTTQPNTVVALIHDRMPVALDREGAIAWLDNPSRQTLRPAPDDFLVARAVSLRVNSARNDDPECLAPR